MWRLCAVLMLCAAAVYAQSPTEPSMVSQTQAGSGQTSGQSGSTSSGNNANNMNSPTANRNNMNIPVSSGNNMNNPMSSGNNMNTAMSNGNNMNNPMSNGNMMNNPMSNGNNMNNQISNGNMMNNPMSNGNMMNNPMSNGNMMNNPMSNGNMMNNPMSNGNMMNNPMSNGNMMNNPMSNGNMINNPMSSRNMMPNNVMKNIIHFRNRMMHRHRQNPSSNPTQGSQTTYGSSQTGLHMLPFIFGSDRATQMAMMNMMMKNPAMAKFLPVAMMNGGMSDSMMRLMVLLGMSQQQGSQGQGQKPGQDMNALMLMAMAGHDIHNLFPFMLANQNGGNSASTAAASGPGNAVAPGATPSQGSNPILDMIMMSNIL